MTNEEIAEVLEFISQILKAQGANRFRAAAYENAAASIKIYPKQLHEMFLSDPDFNKIPAVGETLTQKLTELFTTGNVKALQKYVEKIPAGTYPLVKVYGIGGKRALFLAQHFNLDNESTAIETLLAHAKSGRIAGLPNFGEKREQEIIQQLTEYSMGKKRVAYNEASQIAEKIIGYLIKCKDVTKIEALGSLRRHSPTVGDVDLGIAIKDIGRVKEFVKNVEIVKNIVVAGEGLIRVFLDDGTQVDIKISTKEEWGSFLQHFTGSKEHNIKLREFALEKNMSLSEHGIKILSPDSHQEIELKRFANEKEFYHALGLRWIPPEERVGKDEIQRYLLQ